MKITIVTDSFPPVINGVSRVASWLATNLVSVRGAQVTVVTARTSRGARPMVVSLLDDSVKLIGIPVYPRDAYRVPLLGRESRLLVCEAIHSADIVHAHNIHSVFTPFLLLLCKSRNLIFQPHYGGMFFRGPSRLLAPWFSRTVARRVSLLSGTHVFVSVYEKVSYRNYLSRDVDGIVIPNPIPRDTRAIRRSEPDGIVLVYAGRLDYYKHPEILLDVARLVSRLTGERVHVRYVGEGPARKLLESRIRSYSDLSVRVHGRLDRRQFLEALASSTALILPSEGEAYGIVVGEALALGLPVIVPRPWGIIWRRYCPDRTLLVSHYRDIEGMARRVIEAIGLRDSRRTCRVPDEEEVFKAYLSLYDRIASGSL